MNFRVLFLAFALRSSFGDDVPRFRSDLFEGDIAGFKDLAGVQNFVEEDNRLFDSQVDEIKKGPLRLHNAVRNPSRLWPQGRVPYVISARFPGHERSRIVQGFQEYHRKTCIRFVQRSTERDYIMIRPLAGCWSHVGRGGHGSVGMQQVSLQSGSCVRHGTVVHELMHALGFWHEQSRADRDHWVNVWWQNIMPGMQGNFQSYDLRRIQHLGAPYDYASVMHYPQWAFSRNGRATITRKRSGTEIGQARGLSHWDVVKINRLYECSGHPGEGCDQKVDGSSHCPYWAKQGECKKNPANMLVNCQKSCCNDETKCDDMEDTNRSDFCQDWSRKGECDKNPLNMLVYCKKSCCLVGKEDITTATTPAPSDCSGLVNNGAFCKDWSRKGECTANPAYMDTQCKKSCCELEKRKSTPKPGNCSEYSDKGLHCSDWRRKGECGKNAEYMLANCQKSCCLAGHEITTTTEATTSSPEVNECSALEDIHKDCENWTQNDECQKDPGNMLYFCKKTCCEQELNKTMGCKMEDNVDYRGNDMKRFPNISNPHICCMKCSEIDGCVGFTWDKVRKNCWLKDSLGRRKTSGSFHTLSGIRKS